MTEKGKKSLSRKMLVQFIICTAVLMLLATPLFYMLTKRYYAEDMIDIIEAVQQGKPIPALDLEEDIMHGIMIQFFLITAVLGVALVLMMRFISRRLWKPFDETLARIEGFRLEEGRVPVLPDSSISEFSRLNNALSTLMKNSLASYRMQKEFTENASHELQTPLAVFQSRLDLLLQSPDLTEGQAEAVQSLYQMSARLSRLNRNLLLLARIDNSQYSHMEEIDVVQTVCDMMPYLENMAADIAIRTDFPSVPVHILANRTLLESLVTNLAVNALRHNRPGGDMTIAVTPDSLAVSNTSDGHPLDSTHIFNRFWKPSENAGGNGLGLAIVKSICDCHGWQVRYDHVAGQHVFSIIF